MKNLFASSDNLLGYEETARIAEDLAAKYGHDALAFAHGRAHRACAVGDDLAYAAWHAVIDETRDLLQRSPWRHF